MHDELVPIRIAKLRHPANRRFRLLHVERHPAFLQFADRRINVVHFESDRCSVPRWLPRRMTADSNRGRAQFIFNPRPAHCRRRRLQLQRFLVKLSRSLGVTYRYRNEGNFLDHDDFNLWMMILFPSGSWTTAMRQTGLSIPSAANVTFAAFRSLIAASKSSTSIA